MQDVPNANLDLVCLSLDHDLSRKLERCHGDIVAINGRISDKIHLINSNAAFNSNIYGYGFTNNTNTCDLEKRGTQIFFILTMIHKIFTNYNLSISKLCVKSMYNLFFI